MTARRQLSAPDGGLRLGLAGKPEKKSGSAGVGLGVRTDAIQERRALFLLPAFERVHQRRDVDMG
jgi:hypothetical protein